MNRFRSDRGAAAVEFGLVVVPLILLLVGIIEFGRAYSWDLTLSAAAREGVRVMALQNNPAAARSATQVAAQDLSPALAGSQIAISPSACSVGTNATVTITYPLTSMTGLFAPVFNGRNIRAVGVMRCGG